VAANFVAVSHCCGGLLQCALQLLVSLFLNCLSILQLFDQLHLQLLHLHHFLFLLSSQVVLVVNTVIVVLLDLVDASLAIFLDFHRSQALLLVHDLILHAVLLLNLKALELLFLFVLLLYHFGLLGFLALGLEDGFLHFAFLIGALLVQ